MIKDKNYFMKKALDQAKKAYERGEVPVGCIIIKDENIISRGYNIKEKYQNPILHAEVIAIQKATRKLNSWRLDGCDMFVTLEPCPMCAGAIIQSRINKVFIGTNDIKSGAVSSVIKLFDIVNFNHRVEYEFGILRNESNRLLINFFKELREAKKRLKQN